MTSKETEKWTDHLSIMVLTSFCSVSIQLDKQFLTVLK